MKNLRNKNQPPNADLVQQYLESSWDIVTAVYKQLDNIEDLAQAIEDGNLDDFLAETDINTLAKLNAIIADATLGDSGDFATAAQGALADNSVQLPFANQAEAEAGVNNTRPMTPLRTAQAIAVLAAGLQNELNGAGPPGANDDTTAGFSVGSFWIDTTSVPNESYRCTNATAGAAVWIKTTLTTDELATVAVSGDSDDLIEGATNLLLTVAERLKLAGIEAGATGDLTGSEIKALLFGEADTNNLTDALLTKLNGIEAGATADQSNSEIETAYNTQVPIASQAEVEAGTLTVTRRFTPERIKQAIDALAVGGLASINIQTGTSYTIQASDAGKIIIFTNAAAIAVTLPDDLVNFIQFTVLQAGAGVPTVTRSGTDTINGASTGVTPSAQWKGAYFTQYAAGEWLALL